MTSQLIFVTGAYGYLGAHVVHQLLEKGYRVRGAARGAKIDLSKQVFASYGDKFEVVSVDDIAIDDISEHLKGVTAVVHTAAPLSSRGSPKVILSGAIEGSVNIIRQAYAAGIKKVVYTSSIGAVLNPTGSLTDKDWNPTTYEVALNSAPLAAYSGAKSLAEKAVWEFADAHKDLDVISFCPPFFFGPFAPGFIMPTPDYPSLSTNINIYRLLKRTGIYPPMPWYIDIRDLAHAHVAALTSSPKTDIGRKRLLIASPHELDYDLVVKLIAENRPELKDRLIDRESPEFPRKNMPVDHTRIEEVIGVNESSYTSWQDTILDTVDNLIQLENDWISKGFKVDIPIPDQAAPIGEGAFISNN